MAPRRFETWERKSSQHENWISVISNYRLDYITMISGSKIQREVGEGCWICVRRWIYLGLAEVYLSIKAAQVKLFSALSLNQGMFPDFSHSTHSDFCWNFPWNWEFRQLTLGLMQIPESSWLGMLHPFRKLLPQTLILSCPGCWQSWTRSCGKE